jgi:hypothetical protein
MAIIKGTIERVDSRQVKTKFGDKTVWSIVVDGIGYETFKDAVVSQHRVGDEVTIDYESTKYAPKINSITKPQSEGGGVGTGPGSGTRDDAHYRWLCLNAALRFMDPTKSPPIQAILDLAKQYEGYVLGERKETTTQEQPKASEKRAPSGKLTGKPALLATILKRDSLDPAQVLEWADLNGILKSGADDLSGITDEEAMEIINRIPKITEELRGEG